MDARSDSPGLGFDAIAFRIYCCVIPPAGRTVGCHMILIVVKTDALSVASSFGTTAPASASGVRELVALLLVDCCVHFQ